jgi:hypothetical protein
MAVDPIGEEQESRVLFPMLQMVVVLNLFRSEENR